MLLNSKVFFVFLEKNFPDSVNIKRFPLFPPLPLFIVMRGGLRSVSGLEAAKASLGSWSASCCAGQSSSPSPDSVMHLPASSICSSTQSNPRQWDRRWLTAGQWSSQIALVTLRKGAYLLHMQVFFFSIYSIQHYRTGGFWLTVSKITDLIAPNLRILKIQLKWYLDPNCPQV